MFDKILENLLKLNEGTWALPYTEEDAKKVFEIMKSPLTPEEAKEKLWSLVGNDSLYDEVNKAKEDSDVRGLIRMYLKDVLLKFQENPNRFKEKFDKSAEKILWSVMDIVEETKENRYWITPFCSRKRLRESKRNVI